MGLTKHRRNHCAQPDAALATEITPILSRTLICGLSQHSLLHFTSANRPVTRRRSAPDRRWIASH
ncbi:protein of unknown function (plasmid) [Caballeronia sp. S22]